jgi:hypothetical protein
VQAYSTAWDEDTFYFKTKEREVHMRCRSRFQINVYWRRPAPNINAIPRTGSACRGEHSHCRWGGVNPSVPCSKSHFLPSIYSASSQLLFCYCVYNRVSWQTLTTQGLLCHFNVRVIKNFSIKYKFIWYVVKTLIWRTVQQSICKPLKGRWSLYESILHFRSSLCTEVLTTGYR